MLQVPQRSRAASIAVPAMLPVFQLAAPDRDMERSARQLALVALGVDLARARVREDDARVIWRVGAKELEVDRRSGHVFLADTDALWNPRRVPRLLGTRRLRSVADGCVRALHRMAEERIRGSSPALVRLAFSHAGHTMGAAQRDAGNGTPLDLQAFYRLSLYVHDCNGKLISVPLTGGGSKYRVASGDEGALIGLSGGWRAIVAVNRTVRIRPREAAEAAFIELFPARDVRNVRSTLAYYAAPAFEQQTELAPVWEVSGEIWIEGQRFQIRPQMMAASDDGVCFAASAHSASPRRAAATATSAHVQPAHPDRNRTCGAAWLGKPGCTQEQNKNGFLEACRAQGYAVSFDLGNAEALESIFNSRSTQFADAVDVMFYTGHANPDGWIMRPPDNSVLVYQPPVGGPLQFGAQSLQWLVIAACGPLQSSHFNSGMSNAFDRWGRVFAGLHGMLGYGSVSRAYAHEAQRFMELAGNGSTSVIGAWMRTALEVQPCTSAADIAKGRGCYPVAMYAHAGDHAARDEKLTAGPCGYAGDQQHQLHMIWMEL